jgi:hypothetical protein
MLPLRSLAPDSRNQGVTTVTARLPVRRLGPVHPPTACAATWTEGRIHIGFWTPPVVNTISVGRITFSTLGQLARRAARDAPNAALSLIAAS